MRLQLATACFDLGDFCRRTCTICIIISLRSLLSAIVKSCFCISPDGAHSRRCINMMQQAYFFAPPFFAPDCAPGALVAFESEWHCGQTSSKDPCEVYVYKCSRRLHMVLSIAYQRQASSYCMKSRSNEDSSGRDSSGSESSGWGSSDGDSRRRDSSGWDSNGWDGSGRDSSGCNSSGRNSTW
jgi:hypothetical protein